MTLHLYGPGALEAVEAAAPLHSKQPIQELHFSYMDFESIAHWLPKLLLICPNVNVSHVTDSVPILDLVTAKPIAGVGVN